MLSYLAFIHHGIESASNPLNDGKTLAQSCVNQLEALKDAEQFPPRLLILLASPAYTHSVKPEQLLNGVIQTFAEAGHPDVELMGCSVAAVFFNRHIYHEGALLVCLASRLLKATVRASPDASDEPEKAVKVLLQQLGLFTKAGEEEHSLANRTLFALFPGFGNKKYLAPDLHELLRDHLRTRIPIFGGVVSINDPEHIQSGVLFANREVHRNAIVVANVECGTPFSISLSQGLTDTGRTLNVTQLDAQDRRIIREFREGSVAKVIERESKESHSPVVLFANLALDRNPTVDTPTIEGDTLRLIREVREKEPFHLVIPEPEKMLLNLRTEIKLSLRREWLENPIAALGFRCAGLLRHSKAIGLDLEYESAWIERDLSLRGGEKPFVGGFVDGEIGLDKTGKTMLGNWSNSIIVFGDELRDRTPVFGGFEKLARFAGMRVAETHEEGVDRLTQLIYDIGFPGAMLSFCMRDQEQWAIVGQSASGARYKNLLKETRYSLDSEDVLAIVAREKEAKFIPDSRKEKSDSQKKASENGIISQYIVPLTSIKEEVSAVLQIDLGDISYDTHLHPTENDVLDWLGKIVNSSLNRTFNWEEGKLIRKLDQAMNMCLSANTIKQGLQQYLEEALEIFGLKMGHIRIAQDDRHRLSLLVGTGEHFKETRKTRREIDFGDNSPSAQAFLCEKITIINNAKNNPAHQAMCKLRNNKKERALYQIMQKLGSYANVPFRSERNESGMINLLSYDPWFFTNFHEGALKALGERIGFLLETLHRKESESFLLGVSPQLSQIRKENDVSSVLATETTRFAKAVGAQVASLYLWEENRQRYILRSQHGWARPEWLNAANYGEGDFWTGSTALAGVPRHIPNLYKYYRKNHYPPSARLYAKYAFGQDLSEKFTMEAIALKLSISGSPLGVFTLYRRIKPKEESGFLTTDTKLLQQGADNFAGLISILQANQRENWEKQEHARRREVYDATLPDEDKEPKESFELSVCRQVLKSYQAIKARFYKVKIIDEAPQVELRASFDRDPRTNKIEKSDTLPEEKELIMAIQTNRFSEKKILTEQVHLEEPEHSDPQRVAMMNKVKRAGVPLVSQKRVIGILDIHWSSDHQQVDKPDYLYDESFLLILGEVVGSAYGRTEAKRQADIKFKEGKKKMDQSRAAVEITSLYVMQHQHELRTIIQRMVGALGPLEDAFASGTEDERRRRVEALSRQIIEGSDTLSRMNAIGAKIVDPVYEKITVKNLICSALKEKHKKYEAGKIKVELVDVPHHLSVHVDPRLIEIVLTNLLDNAIESMKGQAKRDMSISTTANADGETITLAIRDTGVGMTQEELDQIEKGFSSRNGRIGLGVPITRMILVHQGGTLTYDSVKWQGTETRITLPIA